MNFLVKSLLKKQLKGVPDEQVDMLISAIEKNPAFFQEMAGKIKELKAQGLSDQDAAQKIIAEFGGELKNIFGNKDSRMSIS